MYIEQEVNIYQPAAISNEFRSQDTKIEAINGKIAVLMTETEMQALTDSSATMYSRLAQAELDIDSLDLQFADTVTRFNAIDGRFDSVDTSLAQYSASINGLSADISNVSRNLSDNYSTTTAMNAAIQASVDGLSSTVSRTYATTTSLSQTASNLESSLKTYADGVGTDSKDYTDSALQNYSTASEVNAAITQSANAINQSVANTYATLSNLNTAKSDMEDYADGVGQSTLTTAQGYADNAVTESNDYTDSALSNYSTTSAMNSAINASAESVKQDTASKYATNTALNSAKEDLEDYADTQMNSAITTAVDNAVSQARTIANAALNDAKEYTDDSLTIYATTEQLTSRLAQTTSDITASVSATYATKTQFDALAIGATNLLRNTRTLNDAIKSSASYCSVEENADGFSVFKRVAYSSNLTVYVQPAPYLNFFDNAKDKTLTLSFMVRSDSADSINNDSAAGIRIGFVLANKDGSSYSYTYSTRNFNTFQISTEWKKFSYTFEWSGSMAESASSSFVVSDETLFGIRFIAYGKYSMEYKMFKLEEGEKATAWSPSPLDAEADILAIDTRLTNAELKITDSAITSTVTSSSAWLGLTDKVDSAQTSITNLDTRLDQAESSITQNANEISTRVTNLTNTVNANKTSADNSISSLNTRMTSAESAITQNASEISTRVSTLSNTVNANSSSINGLKTRMDSAESSITQNATQIATRVAKNGVISAINQSSESITINASKLNLTGYITATNLSTAGQTTINGSNITTGTIKDANSNTTFNLSTGELTINKGSINLGNGNFVLNTNGDLTCKTCTVDGMFQTPHAWRDSNEKWIRIKDCAIYGTTFGEFYNHFQTSIEMIGTFSLPGFSSTCTGLKFENIDCKGIWFGRGDKLFFAMDLVNAYFGYDVNMQKHSILNQSDLRLKDNVTKIESKIDSLEKLNIYEFDWKDGSGHVEAGFIAQELQKVYPELVVEGEDGYLGINTIGMIPHMWGIMQGMNTRINSLEMKTKEQS